MLHLNFCLIKEKLQLCIGTSVLVYTCDKGLKFQINIPHNYPYNNTNTITISTQTNINLIKCSIAMIVFFKVSV